MSKLKIKVVINNVPGTVKHLVYSVCMGQEVPKSSGRRYN